MALFSNLPSGGMSATSRSTKIYKGEIACVNNNENTVFEFTGGGKLNRLKLKQSTSMGAYGYFAIIVDGTEFYKCPISTNGEVIFYAIRLWNGFISITSTEPTIALSLDIEFKNNLKIVGYSSSNSPTLGWEVEIAEN